MVHKSIGRARSLRRSANYPERKAWAALRTLRDRGVAVRRQVPIEGLTVDFAVRAQRLVIEIDGSIHDLPSVKLNDAKRDARLNAAGWRVLRIPAEVAISPDHLLSAVCEELDLD
ncbi:MAG: DUF559 domain-containing protein [Pseudomonadota bacterium]|nr:DUF559 domain-containing protein [Pseudomonadota bacterium]